MIKFITFQKTLILSRFYYHYERSNRKSNDYSMLVFIVLFFISYFYWISKINGSIFFLLANLSMPILPILNDKESFIFHLPLKKSFVVLNIYILVISTVIAFNAFIIFAILALDFMSSFGQPNTFNKLQMFPLMSDQGMKIITDLLLGLGFSLSFFSLLIPCFLFKKMKSRIFILTTLFLIINGILLFLYTTIPIRLGLDRSNFPDNFLYLPGSWNYVLLFLAFSIVLTFCSIVFSMNTYR